MGVGGERPVLRPTRRVELEPISRDGWAPFGWIPVADTDPDDGNDRLEFAWADPHVNLIGHRRDEVPVVDVGLRCEEMFRHRTHTQVLMVLDVPAVIAVAPASVDPMTAAGSEAVRAFSLPPSSSLVLHRGRGTGGRTRLTTRKFVSSTSRACAMPRTTTAPIWPGPDWPSTS